MDKRISNAASDLVGLMLALVPLVVVIAAVAVVVRHFVGN